MSTRTRSRWKNGIKKNPERTSRNAFKPSLAASCAAHTRFYYNLRALSDEPVSHGCVLDARSGAIFIGGRTDRDCDGFHLRNTKRGKMFLRTSFMGRPLCPNRYRDLSPFFLTTSQFKPTGIISISDTNSCRGKITAFP